uniref:Uncharacterized protein n=1 Tax=Acrobeloides nanus TaxID=290746 RepID=A0A914EIQ7_9BILA
MAHPSASAPYGFVNPNYDQVSQPNNAFQPDQLVQITEEDLKTFPLLNEKGKRVFKEKDVKKMQFHSIEPENCYLYILETFTENRRMEEAHEPCSNPNQRTWSEAPPPYTGIINPWEIGVTPDNFYVNHTKTMEIPNSSRIQICNACQALGASNCRECLGSGHGQCNGCGGSGRHAIATTHHDQPCNNEHVQPSGCSHCKGRGIEECRFCHGNQGRCIHCDNRGFKNCFFCNNDGHLNCIHYNNCHLCQGRGIKTCQNCQGRGRNICKMCNGFGNIRVFTKLVVDFGVEKSDYYTGCDVPDAKLRYASGKIICSDEQDSLVPPITNFKVNEINEISSKFCTDHMRKFQNVCRVIKQRQKIVVIPVTKVHYTLGKDSQEFWLYGDQRFCYVVNENSCCLIL